MIVHLFICQCIGSLAFIISGLQNLRQVPLDPGRHIRFIHGIDMDMFHAVGQQVDDLIGGIGNASLFHGFRIVSKAVYDILKALRHITAGQFTAFSPVPAVIGMIPGMMGTVIPASRTRYIKLKKILLSKNIWVVRYSHPASTFAFSP